MEVRQQKLEEKQDFLVPLNRLVPWESFRPLLQQARWKPRQSPAGRKPTDAVL